MLYSNRGLDFILLVSNPDGLGRVNEAIETLKNNSALRVKVESDFNSGNEIDVFYKHALITIAACEAHSARLSKLRDSEKDNV